MLLSARHAALSGPGYAVPVNWTYWKHVGRDSRVWKAFICSS